MNYVRVILIQSDILHDNYDQIIAGNYTVSHFSYAALFQDPHLFYKNAGIEHSL